MKSMQRQFGKFTKRSENQADVGTVLEEFKTVDDMLDRVSCNTSCCLHGTIANHSSRSS